MTEYDGSILRVNPPLTGWVELGRTTLSATGDTIDVTGLTAKPYMMVLGYVVGATAQPRMTFRFNSDSGTNYTDRYSNNGGADGTNTSSTFIYASEADQQQGGFVSMFINNNSAEEKLCVGNSVRTSATGAGTTPNRYEYVGKWVNTSNNITSVQLKTHANNWNTGSECVVLGWDSADTNNTPFWEELASVELDGTATEINSGTIPAKKYLWIQFFKVSSGGSNFAFEFNSDTGNNYARRYSANGGADSTDTSQPYIMPAQSGGDFEAFYNCFMINKSDKEKLMIGEVVNENGAGAGNAPLRRETVGKWANTTDQITSINVKTTSNNFGAGTTLRIWGAD